MFLSGKREKLRKGKEDAFEDAASRDSRALSASGHRVMKGEMNVSIGGQTIGEEQKRRCGA